MPVTTYAAKYAAKKFLKSDMEKNKDKKPADSYDPYFMMVKKPNGKMKKVKKQIPDYIPENDAMILAEMRKRAYRLDCCLFSFLGVRFGWGSVIGLVPAVGDTADALISLIILKPLRKLECGLPKTVLLMMILNIIFDFFIGLVPFVGDLIDAGWRANSKNVRMLEKVLDDAYNPLSDKEKKEKGKNKDLPPATVIEDFSEEEDVRGHSPVRDHRSHPPVSRPQPARVPTETRGGERTGSFLGRMGRHDKRQNRPHDVEMGYPEAQEPLRSKSGRQSRR